MNAKEELKMAVYAAEDAEIDVSNLRKEERMAYLEIDLTIAKDMPAAKAKLSAATMAVKKAKAVVMEKRRAVGKAKLAAYKLETT